MGIYHIRKLTEKELSSNLNPLYLYKQLTTVSGLSQADLNTFYKKTFASNNYIYVGVLMQNKTTLELVGIATILIEHKLSRGISTVAHIEDIVIDNQHGYQGLGTRLIQYCVDTASKLGCYKTTLYCREELKKFYKKSGFTKIELAMSKYN